MSSWEKRPDETDRQYSVFVSYLLLGAERSLAKVGEKWGKSGVPSNWEEWRSKHEWVKRAADYDAQLIKDAMTAVAQFSVTTEIENFRNHGRDLHIANFMAGLKLMKKISPAIDEIETDKLKPSEIAALVRAATIAMEGGLNGEAISIGADRLQESINNARKTNDAVS